MLNNPLISKKQITKTFLDLVTIDSPSGNEEKVAQHIINYLKKIGVEAKQDKYKNVIAVIPGSREPLLLCAHMDTVEPGRGIKPIVKDDLIKSDGKTILGSDDKAGITEILEAVKIMKQKKMKHRSLELVFTRCEETDFSGAVKLDYKQIKSKEALVLDYALAPGKIIMSSPFIYTIDIDIKGRAAHSGNPEKGINAIKIAAEAIAELKLGRINKNTVCNIGVIQGGSIRNGVPENVNIQGEIRSDKLASAQLQIDSFNKAFKKAVRTNKAKLFFKSKLDGQGYKHNKNNKLIKQIAETYARLKVKPDYLNVHTISDANVFMVKGINAVVISRGGKDVHSTKENIKISEMQTVVNFLIELCL